MNKVVCFRDENDSKGDRTPREWLEHSNPKKYEAILQEAARLPIDVRNAKRPKFSQEGIELDDFINRQLVDTAYITTKAAEFLACLGIPIEPVKGGFTAELRHQWGMNSILRDDGLNLKNREDHRHHAVDALIIAVTDRSRLRQLAASRLNTIVAPPWQDFRHQSEDSVNLINVSYRVRRKVYGALNKGSILGQTNTEGVFVRRKALSDLNKTKQIEKIRDATIREIVRLHVAQFGIKTEKGAEIPPEVWKTYPVMPSGTVIKKVRLLENEPGLIEIRAGQFAESGGNHHVEVFIELSPDGSPIRSKSGETKRVGFMVNQMEAARRVLGKQPIIQRSKQGHQFLMSLSINEMFLLNVDGELESLHRVQKMSDGQIILRPHTYAGKVSDRDSPPLIQRRTFNTLRGTKVTVDLLGRIRDARD
jgi:CRISPR-associated endonuclease Csn1